jgi:hypothetical protein
MGLIFSIEQKNAREMHETAFFQSTILCTRRSHLRNQPTMAPISAAGGSQHHQSLPRRIESIANALGRWWWCNRGVGGSLGDVTPPTTPRIASIYDDVGVVVAVTSHTELITRPQRHDGPRMMVVLPMSAGGNGWLLCLTAYVQKDRKVRFGTFCKSAHRWLCLC